MEILKLIFKYTEYILLIYFGFSSLYVLSFAVAGILRRKRTYPDSIIKSKIAVLIPCYKEDSVIIDTVKTAIIQKYPLDKFEIIVIADSFKNETLIKLEALPVRIINVSFKSSTKAKALRRAFELIEKPFDIALVLDADNIMEPLFLHKINNAFNQDLKVMQGHRKAKNLNTPYAILDAISEEVNNNIFRQGHRSLGMSSALIGSGMAFDYSLLKNTIINVNAISGFDKELELILIKQKVMIEYLVDAVVYDEKTQKISNFKNQRRRWISSKVTFFKKYSPQILNEVFLKYNITFMDKIYQMIAPPRIILLGVSFLFSLIYVVFGFSNIEGWISIEWNLIFLCSMLAIAISIPKEFYNKKFMHALFYLPLTFVSMIISMLSLKKAYKKFIHTPHSSKFN
ncbi:glycosyltransferase [Tenacibaculum sp. nBUS_03]|uniref:glycosyltransferase n=1 Tax=Tenacibaculum sp. nBUS_03 TaxID=3395320 RepID=UPI003EBA6B0C